MPSHKASTETFALPRSETLVGRRADRLLTAYVVYHFIPLIFRPAWATPAPDRYANVLSFPPPQERLAVPESLGAALDHAIVEFARPS
jgi:hypothetical protein